MLNNKIVVITGGSGLLGNCFMEEVAKHGGTPISLDKALPKNTSFRTILCDVTNEEEVKNAIDSISKEYGRIDGWVNNAYPRTSDWGDRVENVKIDSWKQNIDMHLNGYFICSRLALEYMKNQNAGSVISLSSIYGFLGPDFTVYDNTEMTNPVAYSAIKGGIINLSRYLASYYGKYNLRVNCISPGGIFDNQNETFVANYNKKVPMKRMGIPQDISPSVAFLLSDHSAYITGHNLVIDGGWSAI